MHHPTSDQIQKVIDTFNDCIRRNDDVREFHVEMGEASVQAQLQPEGEGNGVCGTLACHGGWYALAKYQEETEGSLRKHGWKLSVDQYNDVQIVEASGYKYQLDFVEGRDLMAKDLGFEESEGISEWAHHNPKLWGNSYGGNMFHHASAFWTDPYDGPPDDESVPDLDLEDIVLWWEGVRDRVKKMEEAEAI